jgi:hypothetical protein
MPPSAKPLSPLAAVLAGRTLAPAAPVPALRIAPTTQPTPTPHPTLRPTLSPTGGESAQELDQQLQRSTTAFKNAFVEIAYISHKLYEMDDWAGIGFRDAEGYFSARGLSSWKMYVLLGQRLSPLSLDEMRTLTIGAARLLAQIPGKLWDEFSWVDEARLLPMKTFAGLVRDRGAAAKGVAEPKASLSLSVPLRELDGLERRFDLLRRQHHLATPAATLDFMLRVAELGPGVVTTAERLNQTTAELERVLDSPEEGVDSGLEAARLVAKLKRHLKELHRRANGLPSEVQEVESSPAGGHPAA